MGVMVFDQHWNALHYDQITSPSILTFFRDLPCMKDTWARAS